MSTGAETVHIYVGVRSEQQFRLMIQFFESLIAHTSQGYQTSNVDGVEVAKRARPIVCHPSLKRQLHGTQEGWTELSVAYKGAFSELTTAEVTKHAKAAEEIARKAASSLEDYRTGCDEAIELLLSSRSDRQHRENGLEDLPQLPDTGVTIGRYTNVQHYKDGLFSAVFRAYNPDAHLDASAPVMVALKVTTLSDNTPPHDAAKEARLLKAAAGDNVVPLIEVFQQSGGRLVMVFLYMPYDLGTLLHRKQITYDSGRTILKDLFSSLAHLHKLGIIHRDVKPSNILLAGVNGPAYIADFGIAWSPHDPASEPPEEKVLDVGTTCYRPPELLFGNSKYDSSLDMWAVGCVVAQIVCLNGKTLFDAGDLGSELALIKSIFESLGTPDLDIWPEASNFPDWGKMNFKEYPARSWQELLPAADHDAIDLVKNLVVNESSRRLTAEDALDHAYFKGR